MGPAYAGLNLIMMNERKVQTCSELKQTARGIMLGKYRAAISVLLATELIITVITLLASINGVAYTLTDWLIQFLITFIISLFSAILYVGINAFYLNIACQKPYQLSDIFTGFRTSPDKAIGIQFFVQLLSLLPLLIILTFIFYLISPLLGGGHYSLSNDTAAVLSFIFLLTILLIIGISISLWISYGYSQCFYLLLDFPQKNIFQLMKMSRKLMKGQKLRFLYLQLSFLPLLFASLLSLGIGFLFVTPYQNMSYTLFYLDLLGYKAAMEQTDDSPLQNMPRIDYQV
ncbi:MAG: DUF975 family protein [Lachnospiraceae bacterium]